MLFCQLSHKPITSMDGGNCTLCRWLRAITGWTFSSLRSSKSAPPASSKLPSLNNNSDSRSRSNSICTFRFLDNFTSQTGLVECFGCRTPQLGQNVLEELLGKKKRGGWIKKRRLCRLECKACARQFWGKATQHPSSADLVYNSRSTWHSKPSRLSSSLRL